MAAPPTGTVTFLYTDIEGSTRRWDERPEQMRVAVDTHFAVLRHAVEAQGGHVFRTQGDGLCSAFATAPDAVAAALSAQRALQAGPSPAPLRVRMALHTGTADAQAGDYVGACLNRVARILSVGYGGQTLLSRTTADLAQDKLPAGASLRDLGEHALRDLARAERLFQLLHPDLRDEFPPLRSHGSALNNLPRLLTTFVGREHELAEVKRSLMDAALLTLTGAGGCGKTRLALEAASALLEDFPDGVWLADLAATTDPERLPGVLANALQLREEPGRSLVETLADALRTKRLLLVLDNCEHLVEPCARLAEALLRSCADLRILATSRESLGVAGEVAWRVPSLRTPDPELLPPVEQLERYDAVRLFAERARLARPGFAVTPANAAAVARVCHQLDGIPLALELAAARVAVLPVEQIAARLHDRFRLLTGGT